LDLRNQRKKDHASFYCVACGKPMIYSGESEEEKLRRLFHQEQQAHDQAKARARDAEARAVNLARTAMRLRRRAANGVCPCCKRSFKELAAHMKTKHPDYAVAKQE
jgi:predicted nucleotidyltransferase